MKRINCIKNIEQDEIRSGLFVDIFPVDFEGVYLPAPIGYEGVLNSYYGNWHELVRGGSAHEGITMSADIPYKEYLQKCKV